MPQKVRSFFRAAFRRDNNPKDRAGPNEQGQGLCDIQDAAVLTIPTSQDCKDTTQISDTNKNNSRLATPPSPGPKQPTPIPIFPSEAQPAPTPPIDSADRDSAIDSLPVRLWDRAYNDFKREEMELVDAYERILSRQLQDGLGSAVPASQPNIIAQDKSDMRRRQMTQLIQSGLTKTEREAKLKENLRVPVDVVLSAKNTISLAIQAVPQAALAWTGICVALEVLANPITETEANRKGIDYVIKRMDWYWSLSNSLFKDPSDHAPDLTGARSELENRIVDLYKALLSYQIKSVYSYFRHRGLILFRDMIKLDDWDAELKAIQDSEKSFRDDTQAYNTQQMVSGLQHIVRQGRNQEIQQISEQDQKCLQHLRLTNPRDDKDRIERTKGGLLQGSYRWVLSNHDFQQWHDHGESRLLWIKGDPGKGKTMLLCGIINELEQGLNANVRDSNVAYFFCQATDSRINNAAAVLRGLIYMLVDQQRSLLSYVRSEYDRAGEGLFNDANTWDVLLRIFTNILQDRGLRMTYLVIDALDECVTNLSDLLDLIAQKSSESSRVKWIVSSRNWPQIEERLEMATQKARLSLELNAISVATAVNEFIRDKVDQLAQQKKYDTDMRNKVQAYLHDNANGTFLWVALVCQVLAEVLKRHTLAKLQTFPPGLDSLYARMLKQIDHSDDVELCKQILSIAVTVYRPVSLIELTSLVEMPDNVDSESLKEIISLCGSFLTIRDNTVYFIHQSAKDFLLGKNSPKLSQDVSIFPLGIGEVHYAILLRSLQTMSTTLRRDIYNLNTPGLMIDQVPIQDPDPLETVRYSCVYWIDHLCNWVSGIKQDVLQENKIIYAFFKTKYLYWLEALSLLRAIPDGIKAVRRLQDQLGRASQGQLTAIIRDAYRFSLSYGRIIEQAPLQAYISALIFAPTSSSIKENFKQEGPRWLSKGPAIEADWNACIQTLEGHSNSVNAISFSPNGKQVASGSDDETVKIWDLSSGSCIQTLEGHSRWVNAISFSPNGKQVASGSDDETVKIWDLSSGSCIQTLEGHSGWVNAISFSPDGKQVASGSNDETVKIWDLSSSRSCIQTLEGHSNSVNAISFSPNGKQVASGSADNTVKIWDLSSGICIQTLEGHSSWVNAISFSPNGKQVASGSADNTVKIWDLSSGSCIQTLEGHSRWVNAISFSPNGKQVASGSADKTVKIWDLSSGICIQTLEGHSRWVNAISFSPNGKQVASGSDDETVKIWDLSSGSCIQTLEGHSRWVNAISFSPNGKQVASGSNDETVKIWDLSSGSCIQTLEGHSRWVNAISFSPNGKQVASGSNDETVKIWDLSSGSCIQTLEGHSGWVNAISFSPDGKQVASGSNDETVKIWDLSSSRSCMQTLEGHSNSVNAISFSPNGKQVASGSADNTVKIWDLSSSGICIQTLEGHSGSVRAIAFSPDGTQVASGSNDETVKIWDLSSSGSCIQTINMGYWFTHISFDNTGTCLYTNIGCIEIATPTPENPNQLDNPKHYSYGLGQHNRWITCNGQNVVWLPQEYRPIIAAIYGRMIAIGCASGRVVFFEFSQDV